MVMVKGVVQLKNDVSTLPASEYPSAVKVSPSTTWEAHLQDITFFNHPLDFILSFSIISLFHLPPSLPPTMPSLVPLQAVGVTLRSLIQSVDEILPSLHYSVTTEVCLTSSLVAAATVTNMHGGSV